MYIALRDPEAARLMKARSRLGSKAPGYAAIVFGLPFVETHLTDTMATNGKCIFFNRTFVQNSTDAELLAVLFHEGLHVSLGHHLRRGNIDPTTWNIAADYAINLIVQQARLSLPEGSLIDEKYRGFTAEQIARLLKQKQPADQPEQPEPPQGGDEGEGEGQGGGGAGDDTDDGEDDDGQGQGGGDDADDGEDDAPSGVPDDFGQAGEIWDAVDDDGDPAKAPTVDWVEALADFLNRAYAGEPTLTKPARRHLWAGNYFPSMQGTGGGDLVIAIDTSGSVSQDEAEQFASEIDSIREMVKPDRTCVIYCDDTIQKGCDGQSYDVFDSYEDIEVRLIEGNGTRFDPPFFLVDQEGLEPHAFIYFTDGWASVEKRTADVVNYPVLWATTGREPSFRGQEFGEIVQIDLA